MIQVGGTFYCPTCEESYHSSEPHFCPEPVMTPEQLRIAELKLRATADFWENPKWGDVQFLLAQLVERDRRIEELKTLNELREEMLSLWRQAPMADGEFDAD